MDVPLLLVADEHLTGPEWVTVDALPAALRPSCCRSR